MSANLGPNLDEVIPDGDDVGVFENLEPETVDGPLGLPVVKPKGLPDPPGGNSVGGSLFD